MGIGPDGAPWPVHASASTDYGAGALLGLVAGLALGPDGAVLAPPAPPLAALATLTASLMTRGMLDTGDVAERYAALGAPPPSPLLRVTPVALFYAGQTELVVQSALAEAALTGAGPREALAAALVGAALSAGTYDLVSAYDMVVAAVAGLDAAALALPHDGGARDELREALRVAVGAAPPRADATPDATARAVRVAFWHLLHTDELAPALRAAATTGDPLTTALTGCLMGAALGVDAVPSAWRAALASAAAPLLALLAPPA